MDLLFSGEWLTTVHVLGAAQGLFLAAILASRRHNTVANRLLAGLMVAFSLELLTTVYHDRGWDEAFPFLIGVTFPLPLLYAPLVYLYARAVSEGARTLRRAYLFHLIPFVCCVLYLAPFYALSGPEKLALLQAPEGHPWTPHLTVLNVFKFGYSLLYLALIIRVLRRHSDRIRRTFSTTDHRMLTWLRYMTWGGLGMWTVSLVFFVWGLTGQGPLQDPIEGLDDVVALCIAVYVYAIGYLGLRQPEIFGAQIPYADGPVPEDPTAEKSAYARSGMDPTTARRRVTDLKGLMDREKPFRNSSLTLQDLSDRLGWTPHNLSEVLNTQLGMNFYDFVNGYRVDEVKDRLADPESAHLTLLAIGLDAGFNSKSTFNAVFKKHAGMTPSEYRNAECRMAPSASTKA